MCRPSFHFLSLSHKSRKLSLSMTLFWLVFVLASGIGCEAASDEDRLEVLESTVKLQHEESEELRLRINVLEGQIAALRAARSQTNRRRNTEQLIRVPDLPEASGLFSKRQLTENAAFHVYMDATACFGIGNPIRFRMKPLDVGGGFAHDDHIYDVPYAGIYVFTWTVTVPQQSQKIVTELYVNNTVAGVLTSDPDVGPYTGNGVHPATGLAVIRVERSDHVSIRIKNGPINSCGANVLSSDSVVRTTFSGWRLS